MNRIELRVEPTPDFGPAVEVIIDGRSLTELLRAIELPHAVEQKREELAGSYAGLQPHKWRSLSETDDAGRRAVLSCTCGEVGCWPLRVRIETAARTVTWRDFHGPLGPEGIYASLGPFVFDRARYDAEVARVARHPRS